MTQAVTRSGPYIWVTWLSKLLVGELSCEWMAWFKAHHKQFAKMPNTFDLVGWQMNHTELLGRVWEDLDDQGFVVTTENQNSFHIRGSSGAMLGGKPDLVAMSEGHGAAIIFTGLPWLGFDPTRDRRNAFRSICRLVSKSPPCPPTR
jgi:hypothetical protein